MNAIAEYLGLAILALAVVVGFGFWAVQLFDGLRWVLKRRGK
jgi:hypothetical protein